MNTGQLAEQFVKKYFADKNVKLIKTPKGELGYDFRDKDSKRFIEVKGTAKKNLTEVGFCLFTNTEFEKARSCRKAKKKYEIHLVVGVGDASQKHYIIPGSELLEEGKPEIQWILTVRKEYERYATS